MFFGPKCFTRAQGPKCSLVLLSLVQAAKKLVFINGAHKLLHFCQQIIEWSGSGVEQKSGISQLFDLSRRILILGSFGPIGCLYWGFEGIFLGKRLFIQICLGLV